MASSDKYRALSLIKDERNVTAGAIVQQSDPSVKIEFLQKEEIQLLIAQGRIANLSAKLASSSVQHTAYIEIIPGSDVQSQVMNQTEIDTLMRGSLKYTNLSLYNSYGAYLQNSRKADQRAQMMNNQVNQTTEQCGTAQVRPGNAGTQMQTMNSKERVIRAFEHDIKMVIDEKLQNALRNRVQHLKEMVITNVNRDVGEDVVQQVSFEVKDIANRTGGYFGGYIDLHCQNNKYKAQFVMFADYSEEQANQGIPFTDFEVPYGLDNNLRYALAKRIMYQLVKSENSLESFYRNH